jgi:indole-3-glycerol phosphate synthase
MALPPSEVARRVDPNKNRIKVTRTLPETQAPDPLPGILAEIVRTKRLELEALRGRAPELEAAAARSAPARDFRGALALADHVALIAECKRWSPGAGAIRPDLDAASLAKSYVGAGARAMRVLTDERYCAGSGADLEAARAAVEIPVLRKDFTVDPLHVVEARAMGADAVLLIVRILDDASLRRLHEEASSWGMSVLVEVHDRAELRRALDLGAAIIGINNRDLATFRTDLATTLSLLDEVPDGALVVSESGIRSRADVERLGEGGVDAILVGETLLRAADPEAAARSLASVRKRERVRG